MATAASTSATNRGQGLVTSPHRRPRFGQSKALSIGFRDQGQAFSQPAFRKENLTFKPSRVLGRRFGFYIHFFLPRERFGKQGVGIFAMHAFKRFQKDSTYAGFFRLQIGEAFARKASPAAQIEPFGY